MQSQSQWYLDAKGQGCQNSAEQAFKEAIAVFQLQPHDKEESDRLQQANCIEDLLKTVNCAQSRYEQQHQDGKVAKWLSALSSRIGHYGRILDVLVQHHPEYVSLAWGAMKFLFVVCRLLHGSQNTH
jgi:hypothetical protein